MAVADCQRGRRWQSEGLTNEGKKKGNQTMKKTRIRALTALALAFVLAFIAPAKVFAETKPTLYVSDVMVGMGKTAEEAKQALIDAGYTVLDQNLNQGAGSAFKTEKFVYLGYKTTTDRSEAITDLAVMNMNGGFSFTDYTVLMDKYRDSQIRPFVDRFLTTVQEYRANYASENEGNKAKADFAYSILSHIIEDDSGSSLADLLLNPTKEELGMTDAAYKALSAAEKADIVDLTTALMQGNAEVVFLMEQVLAMAADTNETTWLERLSKLGPDGLMEQYAAKGIRPTDANRELSALYNDTAKILLKGWDDLRNALLNCEASLGDQKPAATTETPTVNDLAQLAYEAAQTTPSKAEVSMDDAVDMMAGANEVLDASSKIADSTEGDRITLIYCQLKEMPYGDGTMYDFFTKPYTEVSGENLSALYPLVSTLTAGQIAAIEFLPMELLLQIGACENSSYEAFSAGNSNMLEVIENIGEISVYLNVNREIFSNSVALTSEALRKNASSELGLTDPDSDLMGLSKLTAISWCVTALSEMVFTATLLKTQSAVTAVTCAEKTAEGLKNMYTSLAGKDYLTNVNLFVTKSGSTNSAEALEVTMSYRISPTERKSLTQLFPADSALQEGSSKFNDTYSKLREQSIVRDQQPASKWSSVHSISTYVCIVLIVISIVLTAIDLYRYYNIDYTPIPGYIVDETDITTLDDEGKQLVVRNDTAYYKAVTTNRGENADHYTSLKDYADLNGDAGREWLALYSVKNASGRPILADSFKVVTGDTKVPNGYETGIHMFGTKTAQNLTDNRYTFNDDLNGLYVYFKTEAPRAGEAASALSSGMLALVGLGSGALGSVLGAVIAANVNRKKKEPLTA